VKEHNWKKTDINDKPGVTLAIISGAGLPFIPNPKESKNLAYQPKTIQQLNTINNIYYFLRLPIFIFFLFSLPLFYFLIKKLLGINIAIFSVIFIGLSPIILGITLIINPDSLLVIFLPLSVLSFLLFQKEEKRKYLYLSGLFLGLSLLTKYVANILYVYFIALVFLEYILDAKKQAVPLFRYLKNTLFNYGLLVLVSLAVYFVLFPATWIRPEMVLNGTVLSQAFKSTWPIFAALLGLILLDTILLKNKMLEKITYFINRHKNLLIKATSIIFLAFIAFVFFNTYWGMKFYDFESVLAHPKWSKTPLTEANIFSGNILADIYSLIFGLTPMVFLFFLFALLKNSKVKEFSRENSVVFYFTLFILFYYIASTINHVGATVRYQIVLYPLASIMAAIGISQFIKLEMVKKYLLGVKLYWLIFLIFVISVISLNRIRPFYFSYASFFLPKQYMLNMLDMGDGGWEISQYLNNLPGAKDLSVWTDKKQVCEKFIGHCTSSLNPREIGKIKFDYFVTSRSGKSKTLGYAQSSVLPFGIGLRPINLNNLYSLDSKTAFKISIGYRPQNFIKISSVEIISIQ